MNLWTKFLQWICQHRNYNYRIVRNEYEPGIMQQEKFCEDCGKVLQCYLAIDWGYKVND